MSRIRQTLLFFAPIAGHLVRFLLGIAIGVFFHYMLYRIFLPAEPFIYALFDFLRLETIYSRPAEILSIEYRAVGAELLSVCMESFVAVLKKLARPHNTHRITRFMINFLHEFLYVVVSMFLLGLCGGWVFALLKSRMPFIWLASPLAGLISFALCIAITYNLGLTLQQSSFVGLIVLTLLTCSSVLLEGELLNISKRLKSIAFPLCAALALAALMTLALDKATIKGGGPALFALDGTDEFGYTQLGDWLLHHNCRERPVADPLIPYQSWPELLFSGDPRFGCFYLVSLASFFRGLPSLFIYDFLCSVILVSAILGVAAIFSKTRFSLVIGIAGLMLSSWFDYSRTGFLGKLMGYPAAIFLVGLFHCIIESEKEVDSPIHFSIIAFLTTGVAILHSGMATAMLILMSWAGQPIAALLPRFDYPMRKFFTQTFMLGTLCILAVAVTGILGIPGRGVPFSFSNFDVKWVSIFSSVLDIVDPAVVLIRHSSSGLIWLFFFALGSHLILMGLAFYSKAGTAFTLLLGPLIIIAILRLAGSGWAVYELSGTIYPFSVCAAMVMTNKLTVNWKKQPYLNLSTLLVIVMGILGLRLPRFAHVYHRYVWNRAYASYVFSKASLDAMRDTVFKSSNKTLLVDVSEVLPALAILDEYGRKQNQQINLQWSPRTWKLILGYRPWPPPVYTEPPGFVLISNNDKLPAQANPIFQDAVYRLFKEP